MPSINRIKGIMRKMNIVEEKIAALDAAQGSSDKNENCVLFINKMDELLTEDECLRIMECQGCLRSGSLDSAYRVFYKAHREKSLTEKLDLLSSRRFGCGEPCRLNEDGSISVYLCQPDTNPMRCGCATVRRLEGRSIRVSPIYCGCCAGHVRYHFQHALGIKIKLLRIASTPFDPDKNAGSEFVYEILV